jgi:N6-adenosine-specific RNA methylase IME4
VIVHDLNRLIATGQRFAVICADPPWRYETWSAKGQGRSAEQHYRTAGVDEIKQFPVAQLAADDCTLLLWATWPCLLDALDVITAWGFTYKTAAFVWVKQNRSGLGLFTGLGKWTRANTEPCLLATRGSPHRQARDVHQVILSPVAAHSRKPDEAQVRIERLLAGPYLELFARRPTPGWTVWGDQIERGLFHQEIPELTT